MRFRLLVLRTKAIAVSDETVIARLVEGAESIPHELICLGVPLSRHPTDAEALELSAETARPRVQLLEMWLFHSGVTVHLVHHETNVPTTAVDCKNVVADMPARDRARELATEPLGLEL